MMLIMCLINSHEYDDCDDTDDSDDGDDDDDDVGDCGGVDDEMMQVHRRVNNNDLRLADSSEDAQ